MGIQDINSLLRKHCPEVFVNISIDNIRGHRLAVDSSGWFYSRMSICHKSYIYGMVDPLGPIDRKQILDETVKMLLAFIIGMQNNGITLVWCWDGEPVPEKANTKQKRSDDKKIHREKVEQERKNLTQIPALSRTVDQLNQFKKLLSNGFGLQKDDTAYYKNVIEDLGFPSIQAPNEGEKIASALAQEGLCFGVWSEDTDNYALGTPLMITGNAGVYQGKSMVSVVMLHKIIEGLSRAMGWQLTQFNLVDLCIMLGNDFNNRIFRVGEVKCFDFIKKYGTIDHLMHYEPGKAYETLNHVRSRQIFAYEPSGYKDRPLELNHNKDIFNKNITEAATKYNLITMYQELLASVANSITPRCAQMVDPRCTPVQQVKEEIKEDPGLKLKNLISQMENSLALMPSATPL